MRYQIFKKNYFLILLSLAWVILAIPLLDQPIALYFSDPDLQSFRLFAREITDLGEAGHFFILFIFALIWSRYFPQALKVMSTKSDFPQQVYSFSTLGLKCLVILGIVVHFCKFLIGRQRPHLSPQFEPFLFDPLNFHWHWQSMPSGHSQVSFVIATLISLRFPKHKYFAFAFAAVIASTRVIIQQHFLSDVILGSLIGFIGTQIVCSTQFSDASRNGEAKLVSAVN